ncbi:SDR family oxidoreductase [Burkholderia singularis]|uniref:Short-chain dehydrogenase/reductase SDR n=1 Tax=Burkholderia singularis TaxID=1503053 RepID=A0A238H2F9_9BURK|nr:Short-chain dehydrogenase/reductase SDR [Burkholderia singularis]
MDMATSSLRSSTTRAIVTGHTRGLGAALAEHLLQQGITVLGLSRGRHSSLGKQFGNRLTEIELDLSDPARLAAWLACGTLQHFADGASCILLFNNAGTVEPIGPLDTQDFDAVARAVGLNVTTPLILSSAIAKLAIDTTECRIVHLSSGAARNPYAGWAVYCATKAALDHHARAVALDAGRALRIASVAPGVVDTDMQATIRASSRERFPSIERFERLKQEGALASPDAVARTLVDYVLSDAFGVAPTVDVRDF